MQYFIDTHPDGRLRSPPVAVSGPIPVCRQIHARIPSGPEHRPGLPIRRHRARYGDDDGRQCCRATWCWSRQKGLSGHTNHLPDFGRRGCLSSTLELDTAIKYGLPTITVITTTTRGGYGLTPPTGALVADVFVPGNLRYDQMAQGLAPMANWCAD